MPPRRTCTVPLPSAAGRSKVTANSLLTVSVVMMALLAAVPASSVPERVSFIIATPAVMRSSGMFGPMTPVEPSSTERAGMPRALPVKAAVSSHSCMPFGPVAAFAIPALTTTAWAVFSPYTIPMSQVTGAALTRLRVNVPATAQGTSAAIIAMSLRPWYLIPAAQQAARKPLAAVTPPVILRMLVILPDKSRDVLLVQ